LQGKYQLTGEQMATPESSMDDLLDSLYLASTDEAGWPQFLGALTDRFRATWSAVIEADTVPAELPQEGAQPSRVEQQFGVPQEAARLYATYYAALDPWLAAARERRLREWVCPGTALCPPVEFERTEFYNEFFRARRYPAYYQLGALVKPSNGGQAVLTIVRDRQEDDYDEKEIQDLRSLVPHLRRVLQIHRKMEGLRQLAAGTGSILDSLDVAVIALDRSCRVRFLNGLAESILRSGDLLHFHDGKLAAPLAHESAALRKLTEAAASGAWNSQPLGGNLTLHAGERLLHLTVTPLAAPIAGAPSQADVLVTITMDTAPQSRARSLADLFHLTPAEIRVSMLLLEGLEPKEIAERTAVTYETVRFQLKSIYRKTGVTRQSELVRLLSRLPAR
jgi:DNA-binding CsgD family transcriptional regulator/PAS domain-containing protein